MTATPPDLDLRRLEVWAAAAWPERFAHEARWEIHRRGRSVTLCEARVLVEGLEEWTHQSLAQLRWRPDTQDWALYWADRNGRWHPYDMTGPHLTGTVSVLMAEIDRDPTGIFKG